MYLWRRSATQSWVTHHEAELRELAGDQLAIIERANRKRLHLEVASKSQSGLRELEHRFGGRIQRLPRDWLKRSLRRKTKVIKIGNQKLVIPAGAAFGTGTHETTAMSLKMLERAVRVRSPDLVVDLGTGSGILALAARILGAKQATGIDHDPIAISTAKQNARLNQIRGVQFLVSDVRRWKLPSNTDIATANLFSDLLISILPRLTPARRLILSGILREQERDVRRALARNNINIIEARRRGKWVAILTARR